MAADQPSTPGRGASTSVVKANRSSVDWAMTSQSRELPSRVAAR